MVKKSRTCSAARLSLVLLCLCLPLAGECGPPNNGHNSSNPATEVSDENQGNPQVEGLDIVPIKSVPNLEHLKARVDNFHKAEGKRDSKSMYLMSPPYMQSAMTYDEFKRDWRIDKEWESKPPRQIDTRVERICSCVRAVFAFPTRPQSIRCVLLLDFSEPNAVGQQRNHKNLEMWEHVDGEWYFGYPGEGETSCP